MTYIQRVEPQLLGTDKTKRKEKWRANKKKDRRKTEYIVLF